jgi:hypothetical protein
MASCLPSPPLPQVVVAPAEDHWQTFHEAAYNGALT